MDKISGYGLDVTIDGVPFEFLPPWSTTNHQTFDLGLIASAKIRYRSNLLNWNLEILQLRRTTNQSVQKNSGHGTWGLHYGQLLHVGDAIQIFNNAWSYMSLTFVIKCWIKSECLAAVHTAQLQSLLDTNRITTMLTLTLHCPMRFHEFLDGY